MLTKPYKLVLATRNRGKFVEIQKLLCGNEIDLLSLADFPQVPDVVEDGATFEENALKKARFVSNTLGLSALADDSGLCVDALSGRPGVMSARYAGPGSDDRLRYTKVLDEMIGVEDHLRTARFVCVMALVTPEGDERIFRGACEGLILKEPVGKGGFGYDPIFFFEPHGMTFGQMDLDTKNLVSHRGIALKMFVDFVKGLKSSGST
jgi:XTP/dITP diphosphohydrolase